MSRLSFHRLRTMFWACQVPPAVYIGGWRPEWETPFFTYLVVLSLAALVESAATDWDQALVREEDRSDDTGKAG